MKTFWTAPLEGATIGDLLTFAINSPKEINIGAAIEHLKNIERSWSKHRPTNLGISKIGCIENYDIERISFAEAT